MSSDVYANGSAIACKKGDGKVVAAFPDVCMSPPGPPAGPIPVPYPNSSFSKDMKNGSKSVKIHDGEVMLRDQSFYQTSPLGNEAATRSFGANVVTHVITGKTYFGAWSMDVRFEGKNVPRHLDLTTSNHGSYPGGPPSTELEMQMHAKVEHADEAQRKCPCCDGPLHVQLQPPGKPAKAVMNYEQWYLQRAADKQANWEKHADAKGLDKAGQDYVGSIKKLLKDAQKRDGCSCKTPTKLLPEPPCNVFFHPTTSKEAAAIRSKYDTHAPKLRKSRGIPVTDSLVDAVALQAKLGRVPTQEDIEAEVKLNHITPKTAGGCPTGDGNLQPYGALCGVCKSIDDRFNKFQ
ncbi:uncharacterized protein DUF4150 [Archangium gephyra]|uniref:Uncharacterized protein DUF4150 n=1 Tax=Archangium gephyra TaxID=48 RepID=A0ABX9JS14_9BACT|nr:DUF4150 domain-containing protein [Archangium gephyra]REG25994.1 uncharacterized protein DUF4150 [Archangium gephyra]